MLSPDFQRGRRRCVVLLVKIAVSVGLVAFIAWRLHQGGQFGKIDRTLRGAAPGWLALALSLHLVGAALASVRWRVLLMAQGMAMPFRSLLNSYVVAAFFNNFLPGAYGGDVIRAYDSSRHTGQTTRAVTVVVLGRLAGLIATVGIAVAAMALNWRTLMANIDDHRPLFWFLSAFAAGVVLVCSLAVPAVARLGMRMLGRGPVRPILSKVLDAMAACRRRPIHTLAALGLSVVIQLNVAVYYALCCRALGAEAPLYRVMMAVPVVQVLMLVIPSINGLGVRTGGFQAFLFTGVPADVGLAAAASLEIADLALRLAWGLMGGVLFVIRRRGRTGDHNQCGSDKESRSRTAR